MLCAAGGIVSNQLRLAIYAKQRARRRSILTIAKQRHTSLEHRWEFDFLKHVAGNHPL